jgi:cbb3-type cytochrome oxidase subunit 3
MTGEITAIYVQTFVTLIAGAIAWFIYSAQKKDHKRNAANSILLEIQGGEAAITKVRDAVQKDHLDVDISILPSESWSSNKHLFVRDFDNDEWETISDFYNKTSLVDEAIRYNKTAFASDVEQIRTNKQRVLATYAEDAVKEATFNNENLDVKQLQETYDSKAKAFDILYMDKQGDFLYKPLKPINDVKLYLSDLPKLTTSSVGIKLKKLAGVDK